ncbi:hypothetical protein LPTSP4_13730 [Leptospira ryugenii]|uniref:DUF7738 domain-containing protein n=1 Tax=Leptospira ryugenii TaxID=1917863 RepID=A0A2P2DZ07_9LEPT|nr:hypothetical protein [Leptospira ryugenii]GBF49853.1 hypothetical protein LPTSP4_13730 [Leptospira ryugenii]
MKSILLSLCIFLLGANLFGKDVAKNKIQFLVEENFISLNDEPLQATLSEEYYVKVLGQYNLKENRPDGLYYTWDQLGIKVKEDPASKQINQISIYLTAGGTSTTKSPFKGKLTIMGKSLSSSASPSAWKNELICQQIFCAFKMDNQTVVTNLTSDQKKFQYVQITLP